MDRWINILWDVWDAFIVFFKMVIFPAGVAFSLGYYAYRASGLERTGIILLIPIIAVCVLLTVRRAPPKRKKDNYTARP